MTGISEAGREAPAAPRRPRSLWERILYPFRRGRAPEPDHSVAFFTDTSVCIGCKACQVACKHWNMLPAEEPRLSGHSYDNTMRLSARTWRHVKFVETTLPGKPSNNMQGLHWLLASDSCKHCADPPCLRACPTGALVHTEYGGVYVQSDICNGCASCVAACPFGVIERDVDTGHSHKCTFCLDRVRDGMIPACAKTCPTASIAFGTLDDMRARARRRLNALRDAGVDDARLYGAEATSGYPALHNIFLLLEHPRRYALPETPVHPVVWLKGDYLRAALGLLTGLGVLTLLLVLGGNA